MIRYVHFKKRYCFAHLELNQMLWEGYNQKRLIKEVLKSHGWKPYYPTKEWDDYELGARIYEWEWYEVRKDEENV